MSHDEFKTQHHDTVLLYRIGDYYEAFDEDARTIAEVLDLQLTQQGTHLIAGFPVFHIGPYTNKMFRAGLKIAIRERNP